MTKTLFALSIAALCAASGQAGAVTIAANATANNGGSPGWAMFFDVSASSSSALNVTQLTTASTAVAGAAFSFEVFTRAGTGLGTALASGPGSSLAGWTSIGTASASQGAVAAGISLAVDIPDIFVGSGQTTGVALVFSGAGPRYFGTGAPPLQSFSDAFFTLTTGDARSVPFTTTGSYFTSRGLSGSISYELSPVPEPASMLLAALGLGGLALRRRFR